MIDRSVPDGRGQGQSCSAASWLADVERPLDFCSMEWLIHAIETCGLWVVFISVLPDQGGLSILQRPPDIRAAVPITAYRSSPSLPTEAGTAGLTRTSEPLKTYARWLGARRGASRPSSISRVTANRSYEVGGR